MIYSWAAAYVSKENEMRSISTEDERSMRNSIFPLVSLSPEEWNHGVAVALNHLGRWKTPAEEGKEPSLHSLRLAENLSALVKRNAMWNVSESDVCFTDFFTRKNVDYCGEEVKVAQKLFWPAICESFPEGVASLELSRFCKLGTKAYVERFEDFLLPEETWVYTKPPRVMIEEEHWFDVCKGLVAAGVCEVLPIEDLCTIGDKPLLNGMFSVGKGEFKGGIETQRLIMNLIPINHLCRSLEGDIGTLPGVAGLSAYLLEEGEVALLSSEDVRCFFYLFKVPEAWKKYLGFNKVVPSELVPAPMKGKECVLVSRVLPMGFINSVSIAQHIHRNVVRWSGMAGTPHSSELRKDRAMSSADTLYRIYLDNFDLLERVDEKLARQVSGTVSPQAEALRTQYSEMGLPRHPRKAAERVVVGELQGSRFDGQVGFSAPKPEKVVVYNKLAFELIQRGHSTLRELQVVCGGFVYLCMFRRALLCGLNEVFEHMKAFEGEAPVVRLKLPKNVKVELARFILLSPLAQMDFRVPVDGQVTCSDASCDGGGLCASQCLTEYGVSALNAQARGDVADEEDLVQVLSVGLFDGIGALRVACDMAALPMAGHISIERDPKAQRVVESHFPETIFFNDIVAFSRQDVEALALKFSNVGLVLVGAGPPCQGVSGLNADRKGALKDPRSSLFHHVPRIVEDFKQCFPWAQVHELVENVASMSVEDRTVMSESFQKIPWRIDSQGISLCGRPRLYWVSWQLQEEAGVAIESGQEEGWQTCRKVVLDAKVDAKAFLHPGWQLQDGHHFPTFTTSRPRGNPGRRPAGLSGCQAHEVARWEQDDYRFPPYQYKDGNGLWNRRGEWRRPDSLEREVIMGFPHDYTKHCLPKAEQKGQDFEDCRLTLLGNSWHVVVVTWLVEQLGVQLGLIGRRSLQELVDTFVPGLGSSVFHVLTRPPLHGRLGACEGADQQALVKKFLGLASQKGEDLLVQAQSDPAPRYSRLRASVPSRLWKWKEISGWKWRVSGDHINLLELRAVLTSVKWKVQRQGRFRVRFLHLTDSLVCLHALTRGRSSSKKLRTTLMRVNSYLLAADLHPLWGYVHTSQNPADRPSRRPLRRRWGK